MPQTISFSDFRLVNFLSLNSSTVTVCVMSLFLSQKLGQRIWKEKYEQEVKGGEKKAWILL